MRIFNFQNLVGLAGEAKRRLFVAGKSDLPYGEILHRVWYRMDDQSSGGPYRFLEEPFQFPGHDDRVLVPVYTDWVEYPDSPYRVAGVEFMTKNGDVTFLIKRVEKFYNPYASEEKIFTTVRVDIAPQKEEEPPEPEEEEQGTEMTNMLKNFFSDLLGDPEPNRVEPVYTVQESDKKEGESSTPSYLATAPYFKDSEEAPFVFFWLDKYHWALWNDEPGLFEQSDAAIECAFVNLLYYENELNNLLVRSITARPYYRLLQEVNFWDNFNRADVVPPVIFPPIWHKAVRQYLDGDGLAFVKDVLTGMMVDAMHKSFAPKMMYTKADAGDQFAAVHIPGALTFDPQCVFGAARSRPYRRRYHIAQRPFEVPDRLMGIDRVEWEGILLSIVKNKVIGTRLYDEAGRKIEDWGVVECPENLHIKLFTDKLKGLELIYEHGAGVEQDRVIPALESALQHMLEYVPLQVYISKSLEAYLIHPLLPLGTCIWLNPDLGAGKEVIARDRLLMNSALYLQYI